MADTKFTGLTANTAPLTTDIIPMVDDPGGTPLAQKMTIATLLTLAVSNVVVQTILTGTTLYTPTALMKKVLVICVGGGGGTPADTADTDAVIGGGGGGGCAIKLFTAADIGASKACVVGATSTGAGNTSGLGVANALLQATGGAVGTTVTGTAATARGGAGGIGTLGDINLIGGGGAPGIKLTTAIGSGGNGGNSFLGGGGRGSITPTTAGNGEAGGNYGGGAGGGLTHDGTDVTAVAGAAGVIYCIEFLD